MSTLVDRHHRKTRVLIEAPKQFLILMKCESYFNQNFHGINQKLELPPPYMFVTLLGVRALKYTLSLQPIDVVTGALLRHVKALKAWSGGTFLPSRRFFSTRLRRTRFALLDWRCKERGSASSRSTFSQTEVTVTTGERNRNVEAAISSLAET